MNPPIQPLHTRRLLLRPLQESDAPGLIAIGSPIEVACQTLTFPHPYTEADAHKFLERVLPAIERGDDYVWAIIEQDRSEHVGTIGIHPAWDHLHAEVGYCLAPSAWGSGYASEALEACVRFAFTQTPLEKLNAGFYTRNPASGRVLDKCGFVREGIRPRHFQRFGQWVDVVLVGLLRSEWVRCDPALLGK